MKKDNNVNNENLVTTNPEEAALEQLNTAMSIPTKASDVPELNWRGALEQLPENEKSEVLALADAIDITKLDNVMDYGSSALVDTFNQCGEYLKSERGTQADQAVIAQVIELSKKASDSYDDFNLVLKQPNLFQKLLLAISSKARKDRTGKVQKSAITNYKLLAELKNSCDSWQEMLKKAMEDISYSTVNDTENISLLEKFIMAGEIAQERLTEKEHDIESKYHETGMVQYSKALDEFREGARIFDITMTNLKKSRVMYYLSIAQLKMIEKSNRNVQISIRTQTKNSMALMSQQLRNAVLNAKNNEVMEGQKAITRLNDELIKEISKGVGVTAEQAEQLLYSGFYSTEAAKEAVTTVITSCKNIEEIATKMLPKMKADLTELDGLMKELEPCVNRANQTTLKSEEKAQIPANAESRKLTF